MPGESCCYSYGSSLGATGRKANRSIVPTMFRIVLPDFASGAGIRAGATAAAAPPPMETTPSACPQLRQRRESSGKSQPHLLQNTADPSSHFADDGDWKQGYRGHSRDRELWRVSRLTNVPLSRGLLSDQPKIKGTPLTDDDHQKSISYGRFQSHFRSGIQIPAVGQCWCASTCLSPRGRIKRARDRSIFLPHAFSKRTRISQKIIKIRGRKLSRTRTPVFLSRAGKTCWRARKMDDAAMNSAKHMRHRCRAIRCVPEMPRRMSMRTSPVTASTATEPMKK